MRVYALVVYEPRCTYTNHSLSLRVYSVHVVCVVVLETFVVCVSDHTQVTCCRATPPATRRRPQPSSATKSRGLREAIPLYVIGGVRDLSLSKRVSLRGRIVHVSLRPYTHNTEQTRSGRTAYNMIVVCIRAHVHAYDKIVYTHICAYTNNERRNSDRPLYIYVHHRGLWNGNVIVCMIKSLSLSILVQFMICFMEST